MSIHHLGKGCSFLTPLFFFWLSSHEGHVIHTYISLWCSTNYAVHQHCLHVHKTPLLQCVQGIVSVYVGGFMVTDTVSWFAATQCHGQPQRQPYAFSSHISHPRNQWHDETTSYYMWKLCGKLLLLLRHSGTALYVFGMMKNIVFCVTWKPSWRFCATQKQCWRLL